MEQSNGSSSAQEVVGAHSSTVTVNEDASAPSLPTASTPAIRFEALEPRVLLSGDVNPSAIAISGSIDAPGQQNHYQFTVQDSHRVVFDSLTNRSDLNWSLSGPAGQIASHNFNNDTGSSTAAFDLAPGTYTVTIDGTADAVGNYALRVIDAAAAKAITPDTAVADSLANGNSTAVYRFDATAGQQFYFSHAGTTGGSASWQLLDPYGRLEGGSYDMNADRDVFTALCSGEYLLMVEGSAGNVAPVDYGFTLQNVVNTTSALTLDTQTVAHIGSAGVTANYTFSLDGSTPLLFDRQTDAGFYWSLSGPRGTEVARTYVDGYTQDALLSQLPAGDYTLSVDLDGASTGDYPFRLLTGASAQALALNQQGAANFDSPRASQLFKVTLTAGQTLCLDGTVTGGSAQWRLLDPYGVATASGTLGGTEQPFTVTTAGTYWLALDGSDNNPADATLACQFTLNEVPDVTQALTLGTLTSGEIALAGQTNVYDFTLAQATQLAFATLGSRSDLNWSLIGPRGTEVNSRSFAQGNGGVLALPAGDYQLRVRGASGATGAYAFSMLDLDGATLVSVGDELTGTVSQDQSSAAYRFAAVAGDKVAVTSLSATAKGTWRLVDQYGRDVVAATALSTGKSTISLTVTGNYTLVMTADPSTVEASAYDLTLTSLGNTAPTPLPDGDPLVIGTAVAGTVSSSQPKTYRFTLAQDQALLMDGLLYNSSNNWTLVGPRGTEVSARNLAYSDSGWANPLLKLVAGDYALTVSGSGSYDFQLLDPDLFPTLTLSQPTSVTRSPANSTAGYQFDAAAGEVVILADISGSSTTAADWRLFDSYGNEVSVNYNLAGSGYQLNAAGKYTLINEGYTYNGQPGYNSYSSFTFQLTPQTVTTQTLAFNDAYTGTLPSAGVAQYRFHVDASKTVVFDAAYSSNSLQWSLTGPSGQVFGWTSVGNSSYPDAQALGAGDYVLSVRNISTGALTYQFQLQDRDNATAVQFGNPVDFVLTNAHDTLLRFDAVAGDSLFFSRSTGYGYFTLLDAYGRVVYSSTSSSLTTTAPTSGEYLLVYSSYYNSSSISLTIGAKRTVQAPLIIGTPVSGSIAQAGDTVNYSFTLAQGALLDLSGFSDNSGTYWSLTGPRGKEASLRNLNDQSSILALPAGTYTLSMTRTDLGTAEYGFNLTDLGSAPTLPLDTVMPVSFTAPDSVQAYQFDVAADGQFAFDASQNNNSNYWRIVDAVGDVLQQGYGRQMYQHFALSAGHYVLLVDGSGTQDGPLDASFALRTINILSAPLPLDEPVDTSIERIGDQYVYHFSITAPTQALLQSLSNRSDMTWTLTGPTGQVGSDTLETQLDGIVLNLIAAGDYSLSIVPDTDAIGAISFRLDTFADAPALPAASQPISCHGNAGASLHSFEAGADSYLSIDIGALTGASQLWIRDAQGNLIVADTRLSADTSYAFSLPAAGRYLVGIESADGNDSLTSLGSQVIVPIAHPLSVGGIVTGSLDHVGVPDVLTFQAALTTRLLLQPVQGTQASWSIVASDGTVVATASPLRPSVVVLPPGTYRMHVSAATSDALGGYAFRVLDMAEASVLGANDSVSAHLDDGDSLGVYRLDADSDNVTLNLGGSSSAPLKVTVLDAMGATIGVYTLPLDAVPVALSANIGTERIILVSSADGAANYTLTSSETAGGTPASTEVVLGDSLDGDIAYAGDTVSYHVSVAFGQTLQLSDLVQDLGSQGIQWQMLHADGSAVDPSTQLAAGDYDLVITAQTDAAHYAIDLLDSATAPLLGNAGIDATFEAPHLVSLYNCDFDAPTTPQLTLSGIDPSVFGWRIYDVDGSLVAQGDDAASASIQQLAAGHYTLMLVGSAASTSATFHVSLAATSPLPLALDGEAAGDLAEGGTQVYHVHVAIGTTLQIHDAGSGAGVSWTLDKDGSHWLQGSANGGSPNWENATSLQAGDYLLSVSADQAAHFDLQLVSFDDAPMLPTDGIATAFTAPLRVEAYKIFVASGNHLGINFSAAAASLIGLYDDSGNLVWSGTTGAAVEVRSLPEGNYTLEVLSTDPEAADLSYSVALASVTPPEIAVNTAVTGTFDETGNAFYQIDLPEGGLLQLLDQGSDADTSFRIARDGEELPNQNGIYWFEPGTYDVEIQGTPGSHYAFRMFDLATAPTLPGSGQIALDADAGITFYRIHIADTPSTLDITTSADGDLYYQLLDAQGNIVCDTDSNISSFVPESGDYFLEVVRADYFSDQPYDGTITGTVLVQSAVVPVNLGEAITVDSEAQTNGASYALTLDTPTLLLPFVDGDPNYNQQFELLDASGNVRYSGYVNDDLGPMQLGAGSYRFNLLPLDNQGGEAVAPESVNENGESFDITWIDGSHTSALAVDSATPVQWTTDSPTHSAYHVHAEAGDTLSFDFELQSSNGRFDWLLFDVSGNLLSSGTNNDGAMSATATFPVATDAILVLTGRAYLDETGVPYDDFAGTVAITLDSHVDPVPVDPVVPFTLGDTIDADLPVSGGNAYGFSLDQPGTLVFNAVPQQQDDFSWRLHMDGAVVAEGASVQSGLQFVDNLAAGDYVLELLNRDMGYNESGYNDFSLYISDASNVPGLDNQDAPITQAALVAGSVCYIDTNSDNGYGTWNIYRPDHSFYETITVGSLGFAAASLDNNSSDLQTFVPDVSGNWYFVGENAPPLVVPTVMAFGDVVTGQLGRSNNEAPAQPGLAAFDFQLSTEQLVDLDIDYLLGENGNYGDGRDVQMSLWQGDTLVSTSAGLLQLGPGNYRFILQDNSGSTYRLQLKDPQASAPTLPLASDVTVTPLLESSVDAAGDDIFALDAQAGDSYVFLPGLSLYDADDTRWTLYDSAGNAVDGGDGWDFGQIQIADAGRYYLQLAYDDFSSDHEATDPLTFQWLRTPAITTTLAQGQSTSLDVSETPTLTRYTVTLDSTSAIIFDVTPDSSASGQWTLSDSDGNVVQSGYFESGYSDGNVLNMAPGSYTLTLMTLAHDSNAGSAGIHVVDTAGATDIALGQETTLAVGNTEETSFYHLSLTDPTSVVFDALLANGVQGNWALIDADGNTVAGSNLGSSSSPCRLDQGSYTLVIDALGADATGDSLTFRLFDLANSPAVAVGDSVANEVPASSHSTFYQVTLDESAALLFDTLSGADINGYWALLDANGMQVVQAALGGDLRTYDVRKGSYTLEIYTYGNGTAGSTLDFRLLDLAKATPLASGQSTDTDGVPGSAQCYSFDGIAGDRVHVVPGASNGFAGRWYLFDPAGNYVISTQDFSALVTTLNSTGRYTLVLDADTANAAGSSGQFSIHTGLAPGETNSATLYGGYGTSYFLTLSQATNLLFDMEQSSGYGATVSISRDGVSVFSSSLAYNPIASLGAGNYKVTITGGGSYYWYTSQVAFRLLDLGDGPMLSSDQSVSGTAAQGAAQVYRFSAHAGEVFTFNQTSSGNWQVYDAFGHALSTGALSSLPRTGVYTLVWDSSTPGYGSTSTTSFAFSIHVANALIPLTTDTATPLNISSGSTAHYTFTVAQAGAFWLDFPGTYSYLSAHVVDAHGVTVFDCADLADDNHAMLLAAGQYTLVFDATYAKSGSFQLRDLGLAPSLPLDSLVSGTWQATTGVNAYQFDLPTPSSFLLTPLSTSNSSYLGWTLIDGYGKVAATGDFYNYNYSSSRLNPAALQLAAGHYVLVINTTETYYSSGSFAFSATTAMATLPLDQVVSATLPAGNLSTQYAIHLDQDSLLTFDNLGASTSLHWSLFGPDGVVFSQNMQKTGYGYGTADHRGILAAGDYVLTISTFSSSAETYSFRVLDMQSATTITPDTPVTTTASPVNGLQVYQFDATAGTKYYFDALSRTDDATTAYQSLVAPEWTLVDPLGRIVFGPTRIGSANDVYVSYDSVNGYLYHQVFNGSDQEPAVFSLTGTYTLIIGGNNVDSAIPAQVSFNIVTVPDNPPIQLSSLVTQPGPDLVANSLVLNPASDLLTGQSVVAQWIVENQGDLPTTGNWNDRIVVRNTDTGAVIADISVPYDSTIDGDIAVGDARVRSVTIKLPNGSAAAGHLSFTVLVDNNNVLAESNSSSTAEGNNSATAEVDVTLAPYADLSVSDLALQPAADIQPGSNVTVSWTTHNDGNIPISAPWSEKLQIRNLSTGNIVATVIVRDDLSDGPLDAGASRTRQASFVWPSNVDASGQFSISVLADSLDEIAEGNDSGTGETNNSTQLLKAVGPDLSIGSLGIVTTTVKAGGLVTITWEDVNQGSSATAVAFNDRIVVRNLDANLILLDTSVMYDPMADGNGPIAPGETRIRSFTFRLPDGLKGAGRIGVTVAADQNSAGVGVIYETNLTNNAESNNTSATQMQSAAGSYADLAVTSFTAPAQAVGGQTVNVAWSVTNQGVVATGANWVDKIVFSTDAIIGNGDDIVIGTVQHNGALAVGESYAQNANVTLPVRADGHYFLGVISDANLDLIEPDTRADNASSPSAIQLAAPYADLGVTAVTMPANANDGDNVQVTWQVSNSGNAPTDLALWNDSVVLSSDPIASADDIVLAGSVTHAGILAIGQSYTGRATITLPRGMTGTYYVIVRTNSNLTVTENGHTSNNVAASTGTINVTLAATADLTISDVTGPLALRPGDTATVSYLASNLGTADASNAWRDRIYLVDSLGNRHEMASLLNTLPLAAGASATRNVSFAIPSSFAQGIYSWQVETNTDGSVFERDATTNNQATSAQTVSIAKPDLKVTSLQGPGLMISGDTLHVQWTVQNSGGNAIGPWVDRVYLQQNGVTTQVAEVAITGPLATDGSYTQSADIAIPLAYSGEYQLIVVTDAQKVLDDASRTDNTQVAQLEVHTAPHADLVVSTITAPTTLIDDPATLDVSWTVSNQGDGTSNVSDWVDRIVLSTDDNPAHGTVIGEVQHSGALAQGQSYTGNFSALLPPGTSQHYKLFVISDAGSAVFENGARANNTLEADHAIDVMPKPYADLQVQSVTAQGAATSGQPLTLSWSVVNNGIGITDTAQWTDHVWLSSNPDGTGSIVNLGSADHIGQLAVGDTYSRSITINLPNGIQGNYYLNVRTGGPFEFIYGNNDVGHSAAVPVQLAPSPDLAVQSVSVPEAAQEGALVDIAWTVVNQGAANAVGPWVDTIKLVPADGSGPAVVLGNFTYDRPLSPGITYTRTEQVRLPSKIEGLYRIEVVTNSGGNNDVYEYGTASQNNVLISSDALQVSLLSRPDLQVGGVVVPDHVGAGTSMAIQYTVTNLGSVPANGRWRDKVYLSLDGTLSGDDKLVGVYDNNSALAPTESYSNASGTIDIPITYRGDVYLIVVADGDNAIDEYPNNGNNAKAAHFYVDPVPFSDLVTSDVVAPDQAVHGATIDVRYKVSNLGSAATRGVSADVNSWTDTVWLAKDPRRPGAYKGDVLLGSIKHTGNLAIDEDYLGDLQVTIPDGTLSGQYYVTVWSDAYDTILEDTLASNINPDDPNQVDNDNYKARAISVLGITPPDLVVTEVNAPASIDAGTTLSFSYTVKNQGDLFNGAWVDTVYVADNADLSKAKHIWTLGSYTQNRALNNGEAYTVNQTVQLAPSVQGSYIIVKTNTDPWTHVRETDESNNATASAEQVTPHPADLQVASVTCQPQNYSGELTPISWTVTNHGDAVWPSTARWQDSVYISTDPTFIPSRATLLGLFEHDNSNGLAAGSSYTTTANVRLPAGTDGRYYIYVITDSERHYPDIYRKPADEITTGDFNSNALSFYRTSVYEGARNDNNLGGSPLDITYREADLQIGSVTIDNDAPKSGDLVTVTWTVTNQGTRATRTNAWYDGVYLSNDDSLDSSDFALIEGGYNNPGCVQQISLFDANGQPRFLLPGESYTQSATFHLPQSISGDFHIIVKADTSTVADNDEPSTIRSDLRGVYGSGPGAVLEFRDEGNNVASLALPITLATPPDLQVAQVTAPVSVIAGQKFDVDYSVLNAGGSTPGGQTSWNDLIYLSRDRFLDVNQDRYLGYLSHSGGLAAGGTYDGHFEITAPGDLEGPYYVFVVTDPARAFGGGAYGKVREFGYDQNNATAAAQPMLVETPPPADLKVVDVSVPAQATVGTPVTVTYSITNDSSNTAHGHWTDAIYLSQDNGWDIGDILLGKVSHSGDVAGGASYTGTLTADLPPLKDGSWRIVVRPDLYNEVYEGDISYGPTGLVMAPGEANNLTASASSIQTQVPQIAVASPTAITLSGGQTLLYKVSVAAGQTLRVLLDSTATSGDNELFVRYGDIPTGFAYDAAYTNAASADQQALIPSTQAGDYYILVRSRSGNAVPAILRADLLPLSITKVTPDNGGVSDDDHRWVTLDIYGSSFQAGAIVKLTRPGVYEAEPDRWQVLDATHIRAVFDTRAFPLGLYDVTVVNPDGHSVSEADRYLVQRGIEDDVTIGIGGPRNLEPGDAATYTVSLQSLTNVDTPYVRFDVGAVEMGYNHYLLDGLDLPYALFGSNVGGSPFGNTANAPANTQGYGQTPGSQPRSDIPWASLDGTENTNGYNLAPGYAFDVAAHGFVGMNFRLQTYPGLTAWINGDFNTLRDALYATHPDWKAQGILDAGVSGLDNIQQGLAARFLNPDDRALEKIEALSESFEMNVVASATALTRDEFIAEQTQYALRLRDAVLADANAPSNLAVLAADATQWVNGWLASLEACGMLRPADQAPPISTNPQVVSLNATLAAGILMSKGGDSYRTQADILGFFAKVQQWYGDTAQYAGDPNAATGAIDHYETRTDSDGDEIEVPVPALANPADYAQHAGRTLQFENFRIFVGGQAQLEYLRDQGLLDDKFNPLPAKGLNLAQYLQLVARQSNVGDTAISVQGPQGQAMAADGSIYVPAATPLPYSFAFSNPGTQGVGQIRIVSQLDPNLDPRSLRLGDLKIGDINIHVPADRANFQGDFDFTGSKGFILRVSAGIDVESHTATWLLQAIDPATGEVIKDLSRALLVPTTGSQPAGGFVSYTVAAAADAASGVHIATAARIFFDDTPPIDSTTVTTTLDATAPTTKVEVTSTGTDAQGAPTFDVKWTATDDASGIRYVTVYVATDGGDFKIWQRQLGPDQTHATFTGEAGHHYEFLAAATDNAGNREAAMVTNAVLPDDGSRQQVLDGLGVTPGVEQSAQVPQAPADRSYADNALFQQATQLLPGHVASVGAGDLRNVLAPFAAHV